MPKTQFLLLKRGSRKNFTEKKNCWWKLTEKLCWYPGQHSWHRVGGHRDQSIWNQSPLWTGTGHSAHLPGPGDTGGYTGRASGREKSSWKTCRDKPQVKHVQYSLCRNKPHLTTSTLFTVADCYYWESRCRLLIRNLTHFYKVQFVGKNSSESQIARRGSKQCLVMTGRENHAFKIP